MFIKTGVEFDNMVITFLPTTETQFPAEKFENLTTQRVPSGEFECSCYITIFTNVLIVMTRNFNSENFHGVFVY